MERTALYILLNNLSNSSPTPSLNVSVTSGRLPKPHAMLKEDYNYSVLY